MAHRHTLQNRPLPSGQSQALQSLNYFLHSRFSQSLSTNNSTQAIMSNLARKRSSAISRQSQQQPSNLSAELAGATTPANDGNSLGSNSLATQSPASRPGLVAPVPDQAGFDGAATTLQTQIKSTVAGVDSLTGAIVNAVNTKADMAGYDIATAVMGAHQRALNTASDVLVAGGGVGGGAIDTSQFQQWIDCL
jgi:hypothetical protein